MMTSEHWTDRLSEYMDGELSSAEARSCEAHLGECPECASTLEDLRAVAVQASLLPDVAPERDLWSGIEGRLAPRMVSSEADVVELASRRRRVAMTVPQLAAAAIALVLFSAGSVWLMLPGGNASVAETAVVEMGRGTGAPGGVTPVAVTTVYDQAILELEAQFDLRRSRLEPETIRVVEQNLGIIDAAIAEANQALADDPSSAFLNTHLANAMRQKVDLLRRVAMIEQTES